MESSVALLTGADGRLTQLVDRLSPGDLTRPTPCAGWDVRALLSHTLQSVEAFSGALDGAGGPNESELFAGEDILGSDAAGVTKRIFERSHQAWNSVRDWDSTLTTVLGPLPAGQAIAIITFSTLVHSWDLAWALGERVEFTAAEATLDESRPSAASWSRRCGEKGLYGPEVCTPRCRPAPPSGWWYFTGRGPM